MKNAYAEYNTRLPQNAGQMVKDREDQVQNYAGGYVFDVGDQTVLDRFLILGTDGPTYYASAKKLTKEAATRIQQFIDKDGVYVVNRVVEISESGRAPKNDPALFVLAMCASAKSDATRAAAFAALPKVARIPTHLFSFWQYSQQFRGSGRALRTAIADWYSNNPSLAYHAVKYQSRNGVSNRDMLRLARPNPRKVEPQTASVFHWIVKGSIPPTKDDPLATGVGKNYIIQGFERIKGTDNPIEAARLIREFKLPREAVPTQFLNNQEVWQALLDVDMPLTALIRNLGKMSSIDMLKPFGENATKVATMLRNKEALRKARIHPIALLSALRTYSRGSGVRGSLSWTPNSQIEAALENAFYDSFQYVEATNKRIMLACDVSGSMNGGEIAGVPGLTPLEAEACLALVFAHREPQFTSMAFATSFQPLSIGNLDNINSALNKIRQTRMGGTDCAQPMLYAASRNIPVDLFIVITDNETWAGMVKPHTALVRYRQKMGIPAKLVVIGMTATEFSIADPTDSGMLDVVGFDSAVPNIITDFVKA